MYSGFISSKHSASWLGAHQKLNRLGFRAMRKFLINYNEPIQGRKKLTSFPELKQIQHFEGINGPDGIKTKSPAQDEPWHYFDPYGSKKNEVTKLINSHHNELIKAIKSSNSERASFEAAWLSHAIVDGLTPAHHYPYEQHLEKIRGESKESRTSTSKKLLVKGSTKRESLAKTWHLIGRKGLLTTHINFEAGVASSILPMRVGAGMPSRLELEYAREHSLETAFLKIAQSVADLKLYDRFYSSGWTVGLSRDVRGLLIPLMVRMITISWLLAIEEASK